jgi:hypothetical protein
VTKWNVLVAAITAVGFLTPAQAGCIQFGGKDPCDSGARSETIVITPQLKDVEPSRKQSQRQIGNAKFGRDNDGNAWSIQRLGNNFFVRDSQGSSKRCNQFGEQLVCY